VMEGQDKGQVKIFVFLFREESRKIKGCGRHSAGIVWQKGRQFIRE